MVVVFWMPKTIKKNKNKEEKLTLIMQYLPMSRWGDEIQTAMHPAVWHLPSVDPRLCIQVILKFTIDVVDDRLPAEEDTASA